LGKALFGASLGRQTLRLTHKETLTRISNKIILPWII